MQKLVWRKKEVKREYERNRHKKQLKEYQAAKILICLYSIKMSEKTFKFDNVEVNKREFPACKQPIALEIVNLNQILISDKFKHSDTGFTYFIGYKDDNLLRPLCIVLPQMNGYIKYFDNGGTNMSFLIEDDSALVKCNKI